MAHKTFKLARGSDTTLSSYAGADGEVVVNLTDHSVHVQNGVAGGVKLAVDNNVVHRTGDEIISHSKTFGTPITIPAGVNSTHAVNKGQLDSAINNVISGGVVLSAAYAAYADGAYFASSATIAADAGSASMAEAADSAGVAFALLDVDHGRTLYSVGDSVTPVYFSEGVPVACTSIAGGSSYTLPAATETSLGGVKVDTATGLTVDSAGTLGIASYTVNAAFAAQAHFADSAGYIPRVDAADRATLAEYTSGAEKLYDPDSPYPVGNSRNGLTVGNTSTPVYFSAGYPVVCTSVGGGGSSYTLPVAAETTLGGVKISGGGLSIASDGVLSVISAASAGVAASATSASTAASATSASTAGYATSAGGVTYASSAGYATSAGSIGNTDVVRTGVAGRRALVQTNNGYAYSAGWLTWNDTAADNSTRYLEVNGGIRLKRAHSATDNTVLISISAEYTSPLNMLARYNSALVGGMTVERESGDNTIPTTKMWSYYDSSSACISISYDTITSAIVGFAPTAASSATGDVIATCGWVTSKGYLTTPYSAGTNLTLSGTTFSVTSAVTLTSYLHCSGAITAAYGATGGILVSDGYCRPTTTKSAQLGTGNYLWKQLFASTTTISTSDERVKTSVAPIDDAVLDAWGDLHYKQFMFNNAVTEKGTNARLHAGMIAQAIKQVFADHGLDASRYGFFCYDAWDDKPAVVADDGTVVEAAQAAGDAYALRYEELLCVEAAYQRRRADRLEARLAAVEAQLSALSNS